MGDAKKSKKAVALEKEGMMSWFLRGEEVIYLVLPSMIILFVCIQDNINFMRK